MTKNVTINNKGEKFTVLKVEKIGKDGKRVFGDKIEIPTGAYQIDELTAEYACSVFADRCSIVAVLGVADDEKLAIRVAELEYALEEAIKLIKDKKAKERLTEVLQGKVFEKTIEAIENGTAPETAEEAKLANEQAEKEEEANKPAETEEVKE